jgi:mannose-6-phosphate isomerase-like protein (cupin superfamily)
MKIYFVFINIIKKTGKAHMEKTLNQNEINKIYNRPWGTYETLKLDKNSQIKWIKIHPNSKTSLQKHSLRSEHWVVIKGKPLITINDLKKTYNENDHVFIPNEAIHRIENETNETIVIIEIQNGSYLGEDDIIRLEDIYERI